MRRKIDEVAKWRPFIDSNGQTYDLSHLDAHEATYSDIRNGKTETYTFVVSYSFHCFAKDYPHQTEAEKASLMYHTLKESRPFCFVRYELSKKYLRQIVDAFGDKKTRIGHAGYGSYATVTINTEEEGQVIYFVPFKMYREKKLMRIHITSAYPEDVMPKLDKVNFFNIAKNFRLGKPLPKPQK